jgi:hypothetical protein
MFKFAASPEINALITLMIVSTIVLTAFAGRIGLKVLNSGAGGLANH